MLRVSIDGKKNIILDEEVFSLESLKLQLPLRAEWKNRDRPVYLQMDERVPYGFLIEMMILFKNAGFPRVGWFSEIRKTDPIYFSLQGESSLSS